MLPSCTSTIDRLSRFHQLNFFWFGSPVIFPGIFRLIIICKKARRTYIFSELFTAPLSSLIAFFIWRLFAPFWNMVALPGTLLKKSLTNRLESCQRFACRVVLQSWNDSHEDLLLKSDLPLLSKRRDIASLCHLYKIVHYLRSSPNPYQPHPRPTLWNLNSFALDPPAVWPCLRDLSIPMPLNFGIISPRKSSSC